MEPLAIVLIVLAVLVALLFAGGYVANARRREAERTKLHARAQEADGQLATAHAEDKGWERGTMEAAARSAYTDRHGVAPAELRLVQVVDRPGTEEDEAVYHADGHEVVLGRQDGAWVPR